MAVRTRSGDYLTANLCNRTLAVVEGDRCSVHDALECVEVFFSASGLADNVTAVRGPDGRKLAGFWPRHWWQRLASQ